MSDSLEKEPKKENIKNTILNNDNNILTNEIEEKDKNKEEIVNREIEEKENNEEESEEQDDIQFGAMGGNKIKFLSKEEINKMREKKALREENKKIEKEKANARHRRMYLRKKKKYLKMLEKEKEEEEKKDKIKEEEKEEELDINLSKKEKNKLIELKQIKEYYIGKEGPKIVKKKENKPKEMIKDFFVFDWKNTEDTINEKKNYLPVMTPKIMFGKGMVGGMETKEDMKDYYNYDENERKKRFKLILKKRKRSKSKDRDSSKSKSESRSRSKSYEKKKDENKNDEKSEKEKKDNKSDNNNDKKKDKEQIKNEIKKRIMPKLNDGTKKFNWKDFNVIYKY